MSLVDVFDVVNYGLAFFYGAFLSVSIAGGCEARRKRLLLLGLTPVFLLPQAASWLILGIDATKRLYPFLIHLPLLAILIFALKKPVGISLVSICTAYLCCQLPRCCDLVVTAVTGSELVGEVAYTAVIVPVFLFLERYFVPSARGAMAESKKSLLLFGALPIIFYVFIYATTVYSDIFYSGSEVVVEMLPTVIGLFYMVYTTAYRQQLQRRTQAELLNSFMAGQLKQAEAEMTSLRQAEAQAAAYQHDMRHHLAAIDGFLSAGRPQQAQEYIKEVQTGITAITPKRFCENELVNLLCSSFSAKAERMSVQLSVEAALPGALAISDTELCVLLSNGLENALNAVSALEEGRRWVKFYCGIRLDKLLIEIMNPYAGQILMRNGLPATIQPNHGHGCRSIYTISQTRRGLCEFKTGNGIFILRVALPM